ncbi:hypothetical protein SDC9_136951 [bioreactor metagenome]|uniref:Putative Se/S carrier protein-like domain-containing protein n=1 Tax=bioreactor metagenome TaxID=1076179 RepID=A0A645DKK2_9ZZZZ
MTEQAYWLFAFDSPHAAIAAQKLLATCGAVVMPTLRCITASCGMSLRLTDARIEEAKQIMRDSVIDPALYRLYRVERVDAETRCMEHPISE